MCTRVYLPWKMLCKHEMLCIWPLHVPSWSSCWSFSKTSSQPTLESSECSFVSEWLAHAFSLATTDQIFQESTGNDKRPLFQRMSGKTNSTFFIPQYSLWPKHDLFFWQQQKPSIVWTVLRTAYTPYHPSRRAPKTPVATRWHSCDSTWYLVKLKIQWKFGEGIPFFWGEVF